MSDLVSRLLAAIEQEEQCYTPEEPEDEFDVAIPKDEELHTLACAKYMTNQNAPCSCATPAVVLRRCAADREEVELHHIVWRDIGWLEWDEGEHAEMCEELPVCGLCVPRHSSFPTRSDVPEGPCQTIRLRARAYGLSIEEETPMRPAVPSQLLKGEK